MDGFEGFLESSLRRRGIPSDEYEASLTTALEGIDYGCFVPDLTRFTAPQCVEARRVNYDTPRAARTAQVRNPANMSERSGR